MEIDFSKVRTLICCDSEVVINRAKIAERNTPVKSKEDIFRIDYSDQCKCGKIWILQV